MSQTEQQLFQKPKWPLRSQGHLSGTVTDSFLMQLSSGGKSITCLKGTPSQKLLTDLTQGLGLSLLKSEVLA